MILRRVHAVILRRVHAVILRRVHAVILRRVHAVILRRVYAVILRRVHAVILRRVHAVILRRVHAVILRRVSSDAIGNIYARDIRWNKDKQILGLTFGNVDVSADNWDPPPPHLKKNVILILGAISNWRYTVK